MLRLCIQVRSTIQSEGTCGHLCFTWVCVYGNSFLTICTTAYPDCRPQCDRLALALCPFCYLFVIPSMYLADIVFPPRAPLTYLVWMRFIWWCPCAVTSRSNSCRARRMSSPLPRAIVRWSLVPGLFQANQGAIWFTPRLGPLCPEQHSGTCVCLRWATASVHELRLVVGGFWFDEDLISKVFRWNTNKKTCGLR